MVWGVHWCADCQKDVGSYGVEAMGGLIVWWCPECRRRIAEENDPNFDF